MITLPTNTKMVGRLNDAFRSNLGPCKVDGLAIAGEVELSDGIMLLPRRKREQLILAVRDYSDFPETIDPCEEHCFGKFTHPPLGTIYWAIRYYEDEITSLECEHADDDPENCYRKLHIMLEDEWQ